MKKIILILSIILIQNLSIGLDTWSATSQAYKIEKGDSWQQISEKFNVPLRILLSVNKTTLKNRPKENNKITIPAKILYKIKNGQTAIKIAISHGMTYSELITLNNLSDPNSLKEGDYIKIYDARVKQIKVSKSDNSKKDKNLKFNWPVNGKITSNYGLQTNGSKNDNIHILITEPYVKAAAAGEVVYVGDEIGKYGNLIIIQHEKNWFSGYGNLTSFKVKKGDFVKDEQLIGQINLEDPSHKPELYFSLRQGAMPVNPVNFLKKHYKKSKI